MIVPKPIAATDITPPLVTFKKNLKSFKVFFNESTKNDFFIILHNLEAPFAIWTNTLLITPNNLGNFTYFSNSAILFLTNPCEEIPPSPEIALMTT